jgi:uncharacterized protein
MITPENIDLVIYHHPCPDGCTSATIANKYFKEKNKEVEFWGLPAGNTPTEVYDKLKNKTVLICDLSFKKDVIVKLLPLVKGLLIIDHHKTAQEDLENLDNQYKIFDMNHCGAVLVWKWFYPDKPVPLFVRYIEDNDIWIKAMPETLEVTAYVSSLDLEFDIYERFVNDESLVYSEIIPYGKILLTQAQKQTENALKKSTVKMIELDEQYYFCGVCNTTTNINEVANTMLSKFHHTDFSVAYSSYSNGINSTSLRSNDTRADVTQIAKKFNGGGHRNASGCTLNGQIVPGTEIGDYSSYSQLEDVEFTLNDNGLNYMMLNTTQNKMQFAQYLLQTKMSEKFNDSSREVQQACALYRTKNKDPNFYTKFDFAITWNYGQGKTWFNLHWNQDVKNKIDLLVKKFVKYDNFGLMEKKRMLKFSMPGLGLKFIK